MMGFHSLPSSAARGHHLLIVGCIVLSLALCSCSGQSGGEATAELHKKLAGELRDNKLYGAAIEEYQSILRSETLPIAQRANVNYLIGRIYFENLNDYENAAAYYVRARSIDPEGSFVATASKNLVASLEKLGRLADAKRQLDQATDLNADDRPEGDGLVASIGEQKIWMSEIERHLQNLPPQVQQRFLNRQAKIDLVHQYVAAELMYRAAIRENIEADPQFQSEMKFMRRQFLVDRYVAAKVMAGLVIDTADVRNFYWANRDSLYSGAPLDSVRGQAYRDYQSQKAQAAFTAHAARLAEGERVEFYEQNVR
jgi:tetratricopeptide (TPR) repeat protein